MLGERRLSATIDTGRYYCQKIKRDEKGGKACMERIDRSYLNMVSVSMNFTLDCYRNIGQCVITSEGHTSVDFSSFALENWVLSSWVESYPG